MANGGIIKLSTVLLYNTYKVKANLISFVVKIFPEVDSSDLIVVIIALSK